MNTIYLTLLFATGFPLLGFAQQASVYPPQRLIIVPSIDSQAVALLEAANVKMHNARTLHAIYRSDSYIYAGKTVKDVPSGIESHTAEVKYMKPSYVQVEENSWRWQLERQAIQYGTPVSYIRTPEQNDRIPHLVALNSFFDYSDGRTLVAGEWDSARLHDPLLRSVRYIGLEEWDGKLYNVIEWIYEQAYTLPEDTLIFTTRTFIAEDTTVRKIVTSDSRGNRTEHQLIALELNIPLIASSFVVASNIVSSDKPKVELSSLVGKKFPYLTTPVRKLDGSMVTTSKLLEGKRAIVLWLWGLYCKPCNMHMPRLEQLHRDMHDRGIDIVAYDAWNDSEYYTENYTSLVRRYLEFNRVEMPVLLPGKDWSSLLVGDDTGVIILDKTGSVLYNGKYDMKIIRKIVENLAGPI